MEHIVNQQRLFVVLKETIQLRAKFIGLIAFVFIYSVVTGQISSSSIISTMQMNANSELQPLNPMIVVVANMNQPFLNNGQTTPIEFSQGVYRNGFKLDSISQYKNFGLKSNLYKYYFNYTNSSLVSKECFHFNQSYTDSLGISELWSYNDKQQLTKYEKKVTLKDWHDTIINDETVTYLYEGNNIVKKQTLKLKYFAYSPATYNGVFLEPGTVLYDTIEDKFGYNDKNQLIRYEMGKYPDVDTYQYDSFGRLKYEIWGERTSYFAIKYEYEHTDTTDIVKVKRHFFFTRDVDLDAETDWETNTEFITLNDRFGRDSICKMIGYIIYNTNNSDTIYTAIHYAYYPNNKLSNLSFWYYDKSDEGAWHEQGRIVYLYDNDNNILEYDQTFYDQRLKDWVTQEKLTYHYSSTKSAITTDETSAGGMILFPNPATELIKLKGLLNANSSYTIFNSYGQLINRGSFVNGTVNVSELLPGAYLIRILNGNSTEVKRFMKK